jgi:hypothetical protein
MPCMQMIFCTSQTTLSCIKCSKTNSKSLLISRLGWYQCTWEIGLLLIAIGRMWFWIRLILSVTFGEIWYEGQDACVNTYGCRLSSVNAGEILQAADHELYHAIVGSLLYLACWSLSRPDIALAVSELSKFVSSPCHAHLVAAKHLLRYLNGTKELGMVYLKPGNCRPMDTANLLWGYVDSDWAGCPDSSRSMSGYVLMLNGAAV